MSAFDNFTPRPAPGRRGICKRCGARSEGQLDIRMYDRRDRKAPKTLDSRGAALCATCAVEMFTACAEAFDRMMERAA